MVRKLLYALCTTLLLCAGVVMSENTFASDDTYVAEQSQFKVWKTIKLGTGLQIRPTDDFDDFEKILFDAGYRLSATAWEILRESAFTVATKETTVDLIVVSVSELGLREGFPFNTLTEIHARAQELGLEIAPAEVGLQLRLQYPDQPMNMNEDLLIAMEPIASTLYHPYLGIPPTVSLLAFSVIRDNRGSWLHGYPAGNNSWWSGNDRFVFVLRK